MKYLKKICAIVCGVALVASLCQIPVTVSAASTNISYETATVIKVNAKKTGTITVEDEDPLYYYFNTTADQAYYEITASTSTKDQYFDVQVEDEDESSVESGTFSSDESTTMILELEKSKKYYISVGANVESSSSFTLSVKKIPDDYANTVEQAKEVSVGKDIQGSIEVEKDIDVVKFKSVQQKVYYQFDFTNSNIDEDITMELLDEDGASVESITAEPKSSAKYISMLEQNQYYYLQINTSSGETKGNYGIKVSMQYDVEEDELENSSVIALKQKVTGSLQSDSDVDCFRFVASQSEVSHEVQLVTNAKEYDNVSLEILDGDEANVDTLTVTGSEKGKMTLELEEPGIYFVKITGDVGGIVYAFSVSPTTQVVDISDTSASTSTSGETASSPYNLSQGNLLTLGKKYDGLIEKAGEQALLFFKTTKRGYYEITYYDAWIEGNMVADLSDINGNFIRKIYLTKNQTANKLYELKAKSQYCVKIYSEDGQGFGTYSVEVNFKLETKDESATDTTTTDSASTQTTVVSPTKFKLSSQSVKLKKGKKKTIKVVYSPKKAKIKKTTWKSANSKIAKVSKKGVIKAMKKGKTKISCNVVFTDGTKRTLSVTVKVV